MTLYLYRSEAGDEIEIERPMVDAPSIGHKITRQGVQYRRAISSPKITVKALTGSTAMNGYNLPPRWQQTPEQQAKVDSWTECGHPRFENKQHAEAWCAVGNRIADRDGGTRHQIGVFGEDCPGGKEVSEEAAKGKLIPVD